MNSLSTPSPSLPRLAVLGSAVTAAALLVAAPFVLPHVSAAESMSAAPYATPAMSADTNRSVAYRPKPSPAHRLTHAVIGKRTTITSTAPASSVSVETADSQSTPAL